MKIRWQSGFSLIEVAVVLVIMGLFIAGLLGPLGNRLEQAKIGQATNDLEDIKDAILGFAIINGHPPCPDTDGDGLENTVGNNCANVNAGIASGALPSANLGVTAIDPWGNTYLYAVNNDFADRIDGTGGCSGATTTGVSFEICSVGSMNIYEDNTLAVFVAQSVPIVILSQGKTRLPLPADEAENNNNDINFVSRDYRPDSSPVPFNDIVSWISTNELVGKMVQAQRLP